MQNLKSRTAWFLLSEDGAVTVDWVVLTASVVGLALATVGIMSTGLSGSTDQLSATMSRDIQTGFAAPVVEAEPTPFERNQWAARTGGVEGLQTWIGGFADQQLLDHMNNQAQFADGAQTGHPYDTYHDEFWVARDEAVTRGLIAADQPV